VWHASNKHKWCSMGVICRLKYLLPTAIASNIIGPEFQRVSVSTIIIIGFTNLIKQILTESNATTSSGGCLHLKITNIGTQKQGQVFQHSVGPAPLSFLSVGPYRSGGLEADEVRPAP
jgi:hypothetical protein